MTNWKTPDPKEDLCDEARDMLAEQAAARGEEDFNIAERLRDYWKHINSHAQR